MAVENEVAIVRRSKWWWVEGSYVANDPFREALAERLPQALRLLAARGCKRVRIRRNRREVPETRELARPFHVYLNNVPRTEEGDYLFNRISGASQRAFMAEHPEAGDVHPVSYWTRDDDPPTGFERYSAQGTAWNPDRERHERWTFYATIHRRETPAEYRARLAETREGA